MRKRIFEKVLDVENAVTNPNFANTNDWYPLYSTESAFSNVYSVTGSGSAAEMHAANGFLNLELGCRYFAFARIKAPDEANRVRIQLQNMSTYTFKTFDGATTGLNVFNDYYGIIDNLDWDNLSTRMMLSCFFINAATASGKVMEIEGDPARGGGVWAIKMTGTPYEDYTEEQMYKLVKQFSQPEFFDNAVVNGNFADGTTGWTAQAGTISATDKILTLTATAASTYNYAQKQQVLTGVTGDKIYGFARMRSITAERQLRLILREGLTGEEYALGVPTTPPVGEWHVFSGIATLTNVLTDGTVRLNIVSGVDGEQMEADGNAGVIVYNLTERFGAGNEPDEAWCLQNLAPHVNYDGNTKLLLHGDVLGDSSEFAHPITAYNEASTSTAQSKFGGSSLSFDSSQSQYLSIPDSDDFDFGAGYFTIDFWVRPTDFSISKHLIGHMNTTASDDSFYVFVATTGIVYVRISYNGTSVELFTLNTIPLTVSAWNHVAIVRNGASLDLFINGIKGTTYNVGINSLHASSAPLIVGANYSGGTPTEHFNGYIDELRISKGIARWTSNFTPPTAPYPNMR